jgi:hypothetical protein
MVLIQKLRQMHTNHILLLFPLNNLSVWALYYPNFSLNSHTFWKGFCMLLLKHATVLQSMLLSCHLYKQNLIPTLKCKFKFNFSYIISLITFYSSTFLIIMSQIYLDRSSLVGRVYMPLFPLPQASDNGIIAFLTLLEVEFYLMLKGTCNHSIFN